MRIVIYGAPGAGKTTAAKLLHTKTGIDIYHGDYLREVKMPKEVGKTNDPFLYIGTKQAWRNFGDLTFENAVKGLKAVRKSMAPYIERELKNKENIIFEAAFLEPAAFEYDQLYLVITRDATKHHDQFFEERQYFRNPYEKSKLEEGYEASRFIQKYLIEEAKRLKVTIIDNASDKNELLSQFKKVLK